MVRSCMTTWMIRAALSVCLLPAAPVGADLWDDNDYLLVNGVYLFVLHEDFTYKASVQLSNQTPPFGIFDWGSMDWLPNGDVMMAYRPLGDPQGVIIGRCTPGGDLTAITFGPSDPQLRAALDSKVSPDGQYVYTVFSHVNQSFVTCIDMNTGAHLHTLDGSDLGSTLNGGLAVVPTTCAPPGGALLVAPVRNLATAALPLPPGGALDPTGAFGFDVERRSQTMHYDPISRRVLSQAFTTTDTIVAFDVQTETVQSYTVPPGQGLEHTSQYYAGITSGEDGKVIGILYTGIEATDEAALYVWDADGSNFQAIDLAQLNPGNEPFNPPTFLPRNILWTGQSPVYLANDCNNNRVPDSCDLDHPARWEDFPAAGNKPYTLNGSAVISDGSVRLTEAVQNQTGSAIFEPVAAAPVESFTVDFAFRMGGGGGADGLSFALIDADSTPATILYGEAGGNQPLAVSLDTYGTNPADGNHAVLRSYGEAFANVLVPHPLDDGQWQHASFTFTAGSATLVLTDGQGNATPIFDDVAVPAYSPIRARYGFGARTGGATNEHRVDNVYFVATSQSNDCDNSGIPDTCEADLDRYLSFEMCLSGPTNGIGTGCQCFDLDGDGDIDLRDFSAFQGFFAGT